MTLNLLNSVILGCHNIECAIDRIIVLLKENCVTLSVLQMVLRELDDIALCVLQTVIREVHTIFLSVLAHSYESPAWQCLECSTDNNKRTPWH